jgi:N-acetylglucosaminyldiphosphoundecaprenol N-acetyl-beta-D-mannosaminyltransferase
VEQTRRQYPNAVICGSEHGYFSEDSESIVAAKVRAAAPHVLFVAMSSPKKEVFMNRWGEFMAANVCHGVGGSFDVMAGLVRRAPSWMQRTGLEWLYRIWQEPRRMWKRYLVTNAQFLVLAMGEIACRRRTRIAKPLP